jgi:hypothetical protein
MLRPPSVAACITRGNNRHAHVQYSHCTATDLPPKEWRFRRQIKLFAPHLARMVPFLICADSRRTNDVSSISGWGVTRTFRPMCFVKPGRRVLIGFNAYSKAIERRHSRGCGADLYILTSCPAFFPLLPSFRNCLTQDCAILRDPPS